mmetsp:Transcript_12146/g.17696  ORF Transcript_12146/g.17696 Transcript_12146/m.17696 type:complete len:177 (-) Transcript_12146:21-551(-)
MEPMAIVSGSDDKTVRVWKTPRKLFTFERTGNLRPILEVFKFLSPGEVVGIARVNKQFYEACFHSEVWKPAFTETSLLRGHTSRVLSVAVSLMKGVVVSGSEDSTVRVWSLASEETTQVLKGHTGGVLSVKLSSDDKYLVSGSYGDYSVRVWDLSTGQQTQELKGHTDNLWSVNLI